MLRTRRIVSCWETFAGSICSISLNSFTPFSPSRRQSKIRMRMGWARALKNSALKLAICCGMRILAYMHTLTCELIYVNGFLTHERILAPVSRDNGRDRLRRKSAERWGKPETTDWRGCVNGGTAGRGRERCQSVPPRGQQQRRFRLRCGEGRPRREEGARRNP